MATTGSITPPPPSGEFYVRKTKEGTVKSLTPFLGKIFSTGTGAKFLEKFGLGTVHANDTAVSTLYDYTKVRPQEEWGKVAPMWAEAIRKGKVKELPPSDFLISHIRNQVLSNPEVIKTYMKKEKILQEPPTGAIILETMRNLQGQPIAFKIGMLMQMLQTSTTVPNKDALINKLRPGIFNSRNAGRLLNETLMIIKYGLPLDRGIAQIIEWVETKKSHGVSQTDLQTCFDAMFEEVMFKDQVDPQQQQKLQELGLTLRTSS